MEMQSETVGKLAAALAAAQGEFGSAQKSATNPHLKKTYADLASVREAVQPALSKHGLAVIQTGDGGNNLVTTLAHAESGEWVRSIIPIFEGNQKGAQGYGSGMTYARRYGLSAILGVVADDDDDGHAASGQGAGRATRAAPKAEDQPATPKADDQPDPQAFAARVVGVIKNAEDGEKLTKWWEANSAKLDKLKAMSVSLFDHVETQYQNRLGVLAQTPPKETADDEECPF